jgi:hypothetical protein
LFLRKDVRRAWTFRLRWEDNIKVGSKEISKEDVSMIGRPNDFTYYTHDVSEDMLYQWQYTTVYCTRDDGCGKYLQHAELSCNKTKTLLLHLVGLFIYI